MPQDPTPCAEIPCSAYTPGHRVHWIQARLTGKEPDGWVDGLLSQTGADGTVVVDLLDGGRVRLWHHAPLDGQLPVGQPVALHRRQVLDTGAGLRSVALLHRP